MKIPKPKLDTPFPGGARQLESTIPEVDSVMAEKSRHRIRTTGVAAFFVIVLVLPMGVLQVAGASLPVLGSVPAQAGGHDELATAFAPEVSTADIEESPVVVVGDPTAEFSNLLVEDSAPGHELDQMGFRAYKGSPSVELSALSDQISNYIGEHEDVFAGSAYLSDYSALEVFFKEGSNAESDPQLQAILAPSAAKKNVLLVPVENSFQQLDQAAVQIGETLIESGLVEGFGVSAVFNTVVLEVSADGSSVESLETLVEATTIDTATLEGLTPDDGAIIPAIRIEDNQVAVVEATRTDDSSPFYMGGRIRYPSSGTQYSICSIGVPITINGVFMVMTAGHCESSVWYQANGKYLGTMHTTAYDSDPKKSNLPKFGDWKLLKGSHYSMNVFSRRMAESATLLISGGTWVRRAEGAGLCMSGGISGSHCQLVVLDSRKSYNLGGQYSAFTTRVRYDPNRNGSYACGASQPGDSGGMYYYSNESGGVIAYGIHRGKTQSSTGTNCIYHAVEAAGVFAWNSAAWVN